MKNLYYWLLLCCCSFSFVACNDDDDTEEKWKKESLRNYDLIVANAVEGQNWIEIVDTPPGVDEGVYYNIVRNGEGTVKPLQTASVKMLYKGYFLNDKEQIFENGTSGIKYESFVGFSSLPAIGDSEVIYVVWEGDQYKTYIWLDGTSDYEEQEFDSVASYQVNGVVRGMGIALQNMVVGDIWEICVPYNLGYGEGGLTQSGVTLIKGYSTLFFEVELLEINQYNQ